MRITSLFSSILLTFCLIAVPRPSQASWWSFLEPTYIIGKIREQIAKQQIGVSIGLIDGEIFRGLSTALGYRLQSEPSYMDGFYTRLDRYKIETQLNPGDLIDASASPLGFRIDQGTEVIFARQFKTQAESLKALPYTIKNIPLNTDRAIHNMRVGDFVALQAHLGIIFSVGGGTDLNPSLALAGSTHVFLSGDFMIHLYRMDDDRIRVKLITVRKKGTGANIDIDYSRKFRIVGLRFVNDKVERLVDLNPLSLGFGKGVNDVFMLDYVFDLKNAQASQAFNNFMSRKVKFKDLKVIDPTASRTELADDLLTDMSEVEQLFAEDRNLAPELRRIDRVFKGSNSSLDSGSNFKLGLNVFKLSGGVVYSQNQLLSYDRDEQEKKYLLDTYARDFESKILFGLFGDKVLRGSNLVFNADESWKPASFVTLTGYHEIKMRSVSRRDYRKVQDLVRAAIPADQYARIDWKNWDFSNGSIVNGYFRQQLFINPEALRLLPVMTYGNFYKAFVDYVNETGAPARKSIPGGDEGGRTDWTDDYSSELGTIANSLVGIVHSLDNSTALYANFKVLQQNDLWRERGIGFILSLIPPWRTGSIVSYEMTFSAKGTERIQYKFGTFVNEDLYKSLMYIQNIINNRSFDLRLLTDESGKK